MTQRESMKPIALYIHFPYCLYKCHYCDFNSYPVEWSDSLEAPYLEALLQEWEFSVGQLHPFQVSSIFLGGGTPSLFSPKSIKRLLTGLRGQAPFENELEITLEANPKTLHSEKVSGFLEAGVNRFSLGIQSFQDRYLSPLGRLHTGREACEAVQTLRTEGVKNFNLDFMFAFPGQETGEVLGDLQQALDFEPQHLSFYNLTLEEGTRMMDQFKKGKIRLPDEEIQAEMYEKGVSFLEKKGYFPYEISNFALTGREARHNLFYWRYRDYLGLGAGAVSFLRKNMFNTPETPPPIYGYRWTNAKAPSVYMSYKTYKTYKTYEEKIDPKTAAGEFWMMGLRLAEGVSFEDFEERFGGEFKTRYEALIAPLESKEWIIREGHRIRLTRKGRLMANEVVSEFLL